MILKKIAAKFTGEQELLTEQDMYEDLMEQVKDIPVQVIDGELIANGLNIKDVSIEKKRRAIGEILKRDNFAIYIPPTFLHTNSFREEVLDKLLLENIPTGTYRLTLRKLLKLPLTELQNQARLLEIDVVDKDETSLAIDILEVIQQQVDRGEDPSLTDLLKNRLLRNEMAYHVGVEIELRGKRAVGSVHIYPIDFVSSDIMRRKEIEAECRNQGIVTSRNDSVLKLAMRLISHFQISPDRIRIPLTESFEEFLLAKFQISSSDY